MGYKFKSDSCTIDSPKNKIIARPLPENPEENQLCIDSFDQKLKIWNTELNRWVVVGDASDIFFDNSENGFQATNLQEAVEEAKTPVIARTSIIFGFDGNASSGRWLELNTNAASNVSGFIVPLSGKIKDLSISCQSNSTSIATIYKNGNSVTSISLSNSRKGIVNNLNIDLLPLDELSVKISSGSCTRPIVSIFISF